MNRLFVLALSAVLAALLAACGGEGSPSPTPTATPPPTPTLAPTAAHLLLGKLPAGASGVVFIDVKAVQGITDLQGLADEFLGGITEGAGELLGQVVFDLIDSVAVTLDQQVVLIGGNFRDLLSPLLQASLEATAGGKESYRGVNIFDLSDVGAPFFMAFPDSETWMLSDSSDTAKRVIDQVLAGGSASPALAEAIQKLGPGYILLAGLPEDLDAPDDPNEPTDLEGLTLLAVGISLRDSATSTVRFYLRFADAARAATGLAWFQDPGQLQSLREDFGEVDIQAQQDGNAVLAEFSIPHGKVVEALFED